MGVSRFLVLASIGVMSFWTVLPNLSHSDRRDIFFWSNLRKLAAPQATASSFTLAKPLLKALGAAEKISDLWMGHKKIALSPHNIGINHTYDYTLNYLRCVHLCRGLVSARQGFSQSWLQLFPRHQKRKGGVGVGGVMQY